MVEERGVCGNCRESTAVKCPCGRPECELVTDLGVCPHCEPARAQKVQRTKGVLTCAEHVRRLLGASSTDDRAATPDDYLSAAALGANKRKE